MKDLSYIELNPQLERVLKAIKEEQFITICGAAGVGKTTAIDIITNDPEYAVDGATILCSSTGISAINITEKTDQPASTFHRAFSFGINPPTTPEETRIDSDRRMFFKKDVKRILIDETSMIASNWTQLFLQTLLKYFNIKVINEETIKRFPIQIIMVGDVMQLESVNKDYELDMLRKEYKTHYFFGSHLYKELGFVELPLTKCYRTDNKQYLNAMGRFRIGQVTPAELKEFSDAFLISSEEEYKRTVLPTPDTEYTTLCTTNKEVNRINKFWMDKINSRPITFRSVVTGDVEQSDKVVPDEITLKVGCKVMIRKNDSEQGRYVNGTLGTVESLPYSNVYGKDQQACVKIRTEHGLVYIKNNAWEVYGPDGEVEGIYYQIPLTVAYAITTHRAQGCQFKYMLIQPGRDLSNPYSRSGGFFANGQLYTCLSRSSNPAGMRLLQPLQYSDLKISMDAYNWNKNIMDREEELCKA